MSADDAFTGEIRIFPYTDIPTDWAVCDGRSLPMAQFQALAAILDGRFGGDGRSSFNLPNLIGMVVVGTGASDPGISTKYKSGDTGGLAAVSLTVAQMPSHSHHLRRKANVDPINGKTAAPSVHSNLGSQAVVTSAASTVNVSSLIYQGTPTTTLAPATIDAVGAGEEHDNMQPYLDLVYCICLDGEYFPFRSVP